MRAWQEAIYAALAVQAIERKAIRRPVLEGFVLNLVRERLIEPEAVKALVTAYHQKISVGRDAAAADQGRRE